MSWLRSLARFSPLALATLSLCGCPGALGDPPPPARKLDIPAAPPHALGALAAGTDAAPKPYAAPAPPEPGEGPEGMPLPPPPPAPPPGTPAPLGGDPDATPPLPSSTPAPPAGMAL